jgi:hypothetical protein
VAQRLSGQPRRLIARTPLAASAERVFDWHLRPGAFERLAPPWARLRLLESDGPPSEGSRAVIEVRAGPLVRRWIARHEAIEPGRGFRDVQERGPFARFEHAHRFIPDGTGRSLLEDRLEYRLPGGRAGSWLAGAAVRRALTRLFCWRHERTGADLERHAPWAARPPLTVAISGATGLVGSALRAFLSTGGHRVLRLVRGERSRAADEIAWDPARGRIDRARLEGLDAVVHLAGASLSAGRLGPAHRARVRDSRIRGTRLLAQALAGLSRRPAVLVSASAIGYYGDRGEEALDETSRPGSGFLAETCREWEAAAEAAARAGIRVVWPRIGVVLAGGGGALARMLPAFRAGLGGPIGGGRQSVSWIALDDLLGALHLALVDPDLEGPLNAVAPAPASQAELARTLGRVLGRPARLPLPAPVVRAALGRMGQELLLSSARVRPARLAAAGFGFRLGQLEAALRFELGRIRPGATSTRIEAD